MNGKMISWIVGIIVVVAVAGILITNNRSAAPLSDGEMMQKEGGEMMQKEGDVMMKDGETMMKYEGATLAGTKAPLLDFKKADYDAAVKSDKLVVLYFYANWCPICKAEFPQAQAAFNQLESDRVIGFRVNYNDDETDADEKALAKKFGVAYQHTKVFVKDGATALKSPEEWSTSRYLSEIQNAL